MRETVPSIENLRGRMESSEVAGTIGDNSTVGPGSGGVLVGKWPRNVQISDFDQARELARDLYEVLPDSRTEDRLALLVNAWKVHNIVFSSTVLSGIRVVRRKSHLGRIDPRFVRLRIYDGGSTTDILGENMTRMQPGSVYLIDYSWEIECRSHSASQFGAYLPHDAIGFDRQRHPPVMRFDLSSPVGRVIANAVRVHFEQIPSLCEREEQTIAAGFSGLIGGILGGGADSALDRPVQAGRAAAMRAYLEQHLDEPDLGIDSLAGAFGASRATIFRDFAAEGGVARFIQNARLDRARAALAADPGTRGAVARAAETWGFSSASHFSRLFFERFGCRPGEVVGQGLHAGRPAAPAEGGRSARL
jgi:AraC-like DNA-binding protein